MPMFNPASEGLELSGGGCDRGQQVASRIESRAGFSGELLTDAIIRCAIQNDEQRSSHRVGRRVSVGEVLVEELPLARGFVRADLATANVNRFRVIEIKSDRDGRSRFPDQARIYSEVADEVTLYVGRRHLAWALASAPLWWEIVCAYRMASHDVAFHVVIPGQRNPRATRLAQLAEVSSRALRRALQREAVGFPPRASAAFLRELGTVCLSAVAVRQALVETLQSRLEARVAPRAGTHTRAAQSTLMPQIAL